MLYPLTNQELQVAIACETARMSYPGSMSRGKKPVVTKGTKDKLEEFFRTFFSISSLFSSVDNIASSSPSYDIWHSDQTIVLGDYLDKQKCLANEQNNRYAVAAKFLNTFMYQLMKYAQFRPLWPHLHLPLDRRVLTSLYKFQQSLAVRKIKGIVGANSTYAISHDQYKHIQTSLWDLVRELNQRPGAQFIITSRIELNYLWLYE